MSEKDKDREAKLEQSVMGTEAEAESEAEAEVESGDEAEAEVKAEAEAETEAEVEAKAEVEAEAETEAEVEAKAEAEAEVKAEAEAEEETEPEATEAAEKGKKKSNLIYNLILVAGVCMLIGGGFAIYQKYKGDADTKDMYSSLEDSFVTVAGTESEEETEIDWGIEWVSDGGSDSYTSSQWYNMISVDFDGLNSINEDVVGWIYQENGSISYPLLYSGDNDVYLRQTLYGVTSTSGSIFVGGENEPYFTDSLTMVYGHNMKNGSMFGSLKKYKNEENFFEDHQYFQIYTEEGMAYRYQIFAYFDIKNTEGDMEEIEFYDTEDPESIKTSEIVTITTTTTTIEGPGGTEIVSESETTTEVIVNEDNTYEAYLETIKERSLIETDLEVTTDNQIIGLFTCSSDSGNRFLVFAVKVDEHNFNEETSSQSSDLESLDR